MHLLIQWSDAQADSQLGAIDYDDLEGNARRRLAGLKREAERQAEIRWGVRLCLANGLDLS